MVTGIPHSNHRNPFHALAGFRSVLSLLENVTTVRRRLSRHIAATIGLGGTLTVSPLPLVVCGFSAIINRCIPPPCNHRFHRQSPPNP
ncbi:hypothetical protein HanRHA438_Chr02g0090541 [Helianthus annuus]|nr:hypothetical protein HanRHA438_Chr02g0090541 [Helianthus annuus]